jgi:creatinine amidohydrolase
MMKKIDEILYASKTREEIMAWAQRGTVVIVPIGSTEQHGGHLPIDTDCRTVTFVSQQAARLAEDVPVLVAPLIPYGVSPHHMMYGATLTLRVETTLHVLRDICESLVAHGFDRILILSGHGGNRGTIDAAAQEMCHQLKRPIYGTCWFDLAEAIKTIREGPQPNIGHSGEMETSILLAFHPETVRRDKFVMVPGITDTPTRATAEKGERAVQAGVEGVIAFARRMYAMPLAEPPAVEAAPEA